MKHKLTLSDFLYYSTPWEDTEGAKERSGNVAKSKGWISSIDAHKNLVIYTMPKKSFGAFVHDSTTNKREYLGEYSLTKIIAKVNALYHNK